MCGIAGIIGTNSNERVQEMLNLLKHRGPDAMGIWKSNRELSLGHVRLSINDLTEAGNQPMFSEDGNIQKHMISCVTNQRDQPGQPHQFWIVPTKLGIKL